jgi:hypothetical protein
MIARLPLGRVFVLFALFAAAACPESAAADDYPNERLPDALTCRDMALGEVRGRSATVLVCLSIECPISNEYLPTIKTIALAYKKRGVQFAGIDPNGGETLEKMGDYARKQGLDFPFLKDAGGKVSRRLLFSVTPEVRLYDTAGSLVYSGRIDDRYRRGAKNDPNVAKDLENALEEVLAGKPVSASRTRPVGCPIQIAEPAGN